MRDEESEQMRATLHGSAVHSTWEGTYRTDANDQFYEIAFDRIAALARMKAGDLVLDAGCGSAAHSLRLARRGMRVRAVDFSAEAVERARARVHAAGADDLVEASQGDLLELPFDDGAFPFVVCWGVLMHIPDVSRAVSELARVVAPGGWLIVSEGNLHSLQNAAIRVARALRGKRRAGVTRTESGLEHWTETAAGRLLARHADVGWLADRFAGHGCRMVHRLPGQFTEAYAKLPEGALRRGVHALNRFWFRHVRLPGPAFGNILMFKKAETAA